MVDSQNFQLLADFLLSDREINLNAELGKEYFYASMPQCVVDSVFSIGVRYESVENTVTHLCAKYNIPVFRPVGTSFPDKTQQISTTQLLSHLHSYHEKDLAAEVFNNRQWTSTRKELRKANAVVEFLQVLKKYRAEYFQDIPQLLNNADFERDILSIRGQGSGITLKYFFMLTGNDEFIKPDRMIKRFLKRVIGQEFNDMECQYILQAAVEHLKAKYPLLTPRLLDNIIWGYERGRK